MSHLEGLREEPLDLPGPGDGELVLLRELVHTQNGDDVLQGLVVLEDLLDATRDLVVVHADDVGVHDPGCGVKGVHGGVDSQLGDAFLGEESFIHIKHVICSIWFAMLGLSRILPYWSGSGRIINNVYPPRDKTVVASK